jgi:hypothetical protein
MTPDHKSLHSTDTTPAPRRSRTLLTVLLIAALLASALLRSLAQSRHNAILPQPRSASRLSGMNSFALGLVLGGLRGPLVMMLWSSIENQKMDRNLEDIDTKIELIRMLQPEFDSVHIYQSWNKAYNLSVMMANFQNKYATVLDALDYLRRVDLERPDNVNILVSIGEIYLNKLGNSSEKQFYITRLREETLPKRNATGPKRGQPGWRATQHETWLDDQGLILPELLAPRSTLGGSVVAGVAESYTGAELQYLTPYNTPEMGGFRFGLSPLALSYNYYKRAAVIQATTGRKHLYMTDTVIDSRTGVTLKMWAEEEWERARRFEHQLLNVPIPRDSSDRWYLEPGTAAAKLNTPLADRSEQARRWLEEALFAYRRSADVGRHAVVEYERHARDMSNAVTLDTYASHVDHALALAALVEGDRAYLAALAAQAGFDPPVVPPEPLPSLLKASADGYQKAIDQYYRIMLRYYVQDDVATAVFPRFYPQITDLATAKSTIAKVDARLFPAVFAATREFLKKNNRPDIHAGDIIEYETYIQRATQRLTQLK